MNQGGALFGRQAYVGLSNPVGTVTLGRQYDPDVDLYGPFLAAPQWGGGYMRSHPSDLDNALNLRRVDNTIKFRSANYRGLTIEAMMNLGVTPGVFEQLDLGLGRRIRDRPVFDLCGLPEHP